MVMISSFDRFVDVASNLVTFGISLHINVSGRFAHRTRASGVSGLTWVHWKGRVLKAPLNCEASLLNG